MTCNSLPTEEAHWYNAWSQTLLEAKQTQVVAVFQILVQMKINIHMLKPAVLSSFISVAILILSIIKAGLLAVGFIRGHSSMPISTSIRARRMPGFPPCSLPPSPTHPLLLLGLFCLFTMLSSSTSTRMIVNINIYLTSARFPPPRSPSSLTHPLLLTVTLSRSSQYLVHIPRSLHSACP